MKKRRGLQIILGIISFIFIFFLIVNVIPFSKNGNKEAWLKDDNVKICAHRGGSELNPENTEKAFDYVIIETDFVDIVEMDVRLTKDEIIVMCHDSTVNDFALDEDSSDIRISEFSFEELRKYNMGKNFVDREGNKPYYDLKDNEIVENGLSIMSVDNFLNKYKEVRDFLVVVDLKDSFEGNQKIVTMINNMITSNELSWWTNRLLFISFDDKTVDFISEKFPHLYVGALGNKAAYEVAFQKLLLSAFYKVNYDALVIPYDFDIFGINISCSTKSISKMAKKRNQILSYYTINDVEEMKKLIEIDADIITTDAPDILFELLN